MKFQTIAKSFHLFYYDIFLTALLYYIQNRTINNLDHKTDFKILEIML